MNVTQMIDLVQRYFRGVDERDFAAIRKTLRPDCLFRVETHKVELSGVDQIEQMFDRLWANHAAVHHGDFQYVPSPETGVIAVRFAVVNTLHNGQRVHKSNCNFFDIDDGLFHRIAVYMAGENTLNID